MLYVNSVLRQQNYPTKYFRVSWNEHKRLLSPHLLTYLRKRACEAGPIIGR